MLAMMIMMVFFIVIATTRNRGGNLYRDLPDDGRIRATADSRTRSATNRRTQYRATLPAHVIADRRTRCAAQRTAQYRAAIRRIHAAGGGK